MASMAFYCLAGFCSWILCRDRKTQLAQKAVAESQSDPPHPTCAAVTLWDGWQGCPLLDVITLGLCEG